VSTFTVELGQLPMRRDVQVADGDAHRDYFTLQVDGTATSLTDATWTLIISDHPGGTATISKTTTSNWTASGIKIDDAAAGQFTVSVVPADVTTLTPGEHYYEVTATFPEGHDTLPSAVKTILHGKFVVREDTA